MKNKNLVLLRTLLDSTSLWNSYKYCKDKKKKGRIIGNMMGMAVLYVLMMVYCIGTCIGYGKMGMTDIIPATCALTISIIAAFFTFLKTNGYLFAFKEYDMLMSLPFEAKTIAGCKFLYMYVKSLPWYLSISVSMLIGYELYVTPSIITWFMWMILSFVIPVIPMLAAAFVGYLITRISAGFRKNNIVSTILTFVIVIAAFASRFIIESIFRNDEVEQTLETIYESIDKVTMVYLPAGWFQNAVTNGSFVSFILLIAASVICFELVFIPVGRSYREINSKLKNHAASRKFSMSGQKTRSILNAIAFKEWKRVTATNLYMVQMLMGEVLVFLLGVISLFIDFEKLMAAVTQDAPLTAQMMYPALSLVVYFLIGMVSSCVATPSLEGKNYWIVQSLPLTKKTLYQGKMLFNMYLSVPFSIFGTVCLCISAGAPILTSFLSVLLSVALCGFSTAWGCVCGIKHIKLDWENEIEVVKQGSAVAIYLFPNMIVTMILVVLAVFLGTKIDQNLVIAVMVIIASFLAFISYKKVIRLSR